MAVAGFDDVGQVAGLCAQFGIVFRVVGDASEEQGGQIGTARAGAVEVDGEIGEGAADDPGGCSGARRTVVHGVVSGKACWCVSMNGVVYPAVCGGVWLM